MHRVSTKGPLTLNECKHHGTVDITFWIFNRVFLKNVKSALGPS